MKFFIDDTPYNLMDPVKDSFKRVKKDIFLLEEENASLRKHLIETRQVLSQLCDYVKALEKKINTRNQEKQPLVTPSTQYTTDRQQTDNRHFDTSTDNGLFRAQNSQIKPFSTGNEGVSTDRQQTDNRHFDTSTHGFSPVMGSLEQKEERFWQTPEKFAQPVFAPEATSLPPVSSREGGAVGLEEDVGFLEGAAKEIKKKFDKLTAQEFRVFVALGQIEERDGFAEYRALSSSLNLTESSIRDYVQRMIRKGIPIEKTKENNKSVHLRISKKLRNVVSLPTLINFRKE